MAFRYLVTIVMVGLLSESSQANPNRPASPECISDSVTCRGKEDGLYPACAPECLDGYFYSCFNQVPSQMQCRLVNYTNADGEILEARQVYNPATITCEMERTCPGNPQNDTVTTPPPQPSTTGKGFIRYLNNRCLRSQDACTSKPNGNYPMCEPDCESGNYAACANGIKYVMPCPVGWYQGNGGSFLHKLVYDPSSDSCEYTTLHCPRQVSPPMTQTTTPKTTPPTFTLTTTAFKTRKTKAPTQFNSITTTFKAKTSKRGTPTTKTPARKTHATTTPATTPALETCVIDSCKNIPNGTYAACLPLCKTGLYFVCQDGLAQRRMCDFLPHPTFVRAQGVFDPPTRRCQIESDTCP